MAQFKNGYALLIAVDENEVPGFALPAVGKDVDALQKVLTDPTLCGYLDGNVNVVKGKAATQAGIIGGLDWLKEKLAADANATAVIYYTGHGQRNKATDDYFLVPYDMGQMEPERLLPAEKFAGVVEALQPRRLLVILDCCHAAGMEVKSLDEPAADSLAAEKGLEPAAAPLLAKGESALAQGQGRAVLSSSKGVEKSFVRPDKSMSIFTYHLIDALNGRAQPEGGAPDVRVSDLIGHVARRVSDVVAAEFNNSQTPQFLLNGENFPVALVLGGKGVSKGELAPKPEDLPVLQSIFNQAGQTVDTQTNINQMTGGQVFGKVGTVVTGGTVHQNTTTFSGSVDTGGGAIVTAPVNTGGGVFVGRDQNVAGNVVQGDQTTITGGNFSGSNVNIGSTLTNVTQTVQTMPHGDPDQKQQLADLLNQLTELLKTAPPGHEADVQAVGKRATTLIGEIQSDNPVGEDVETFSGMLVNAAGKLSAVLPAALTIANQIADLAQKIIK